MAGEEQATPPLEIALGVLGGAVVLALAGFLLFSAWQGRGRGHPDVRVELLPPVRLSPGSHWLVPFNARNDGAAPATQLRLEAVLALAGGRVARGEALIDYLASGAEQAGGFVFADDPATGRLTARPLGYVDP
jgi:uncharacterized protein (TIGR02588 family)